MAEIVWARTKLTGQRPWIFLAGPTTRDPENVPTWRTAAVDWFRYLNFNGSILIPEDGPDQPPFNEELHSERQVHWEWDAIEAADAVMFWIPRDLVTLAGLTTNTEFGYLVRQGNVVLGAPPAAPKNNYLRMLGARHGVPFHSTLRETCSWSILMAHEMMKARPHYEW